MRLRALVPAALAAALAQILIVAMSPALAAEQPRQAVPAGAFPGVGAEDANSPTFDGPPAGMTALPVDIFTSKNFYKDQALWTDPRYYRCNSPRQIIFLWQTKRIGDHPPTSGKWGDCKADYPKDKILSPLPYKTAKEHYEALMAAARSHGGPTVYTKATTPDWDGYYGRDPARANQENKWIWGSVNNASTIVSLLTPEYQKRMVQMEYHEAVDNAPQWNATFCYPEGFMRWWARASQGGNFQLTMNPYQVQFISGIAANFLRQVQIGRSHVQKVPQWYGETVGFWDGETLVTWTANIQAWTQHTMYENSGQLQTVETYKPVKDAAGKVTALEHEVTFYDPEALVAPVHAYDRFVRQAGLDDANRRYTYIECLSNIRNVNGRPVQLTPDDPRFVDYYGRPWAQNWEKVFEKGWDKPEDTKGISADVLDLFK